MSVINKLNQDAPTVATAPPAGNPDAWLKQLESAQWQQRLRYQSPGEHAASKSQLPNQPASRSEAEQGKAAWQQSDRLKQAQPDQKQTERPIQEGRPARTHNTGSQKEAVQSLMVKDGEQTPAKTVVSDDGSVDMQQLHRFFKNEYKRSNAHVMLQAEEVKLWLRDARITSEEGPKLLRSLRQHFARMGLRLAQFTLNGTSIIENESSES